MQDTDYLCPVCEKHYFDDFDTFDSCPECGWEINTPQFDDHNLSDSRNALNVFEHKIQYAATSNPKIAEEVKALRKAFLKERWDIKEMMRDFSTGNTAADFEMALPAFVASRENYIANIKQLIQSAS